MTYPDKPQDAPEPLWTPETIRGWRLWTATRPFPWRQEYLGTVNYESGVLRGVYGIWPGRVMGAEHVEVPGALRFMPVDVGFHFSPAQGCLCGVNAVKDPRHLIVPPRPGQRSQMDTMMARTNGLVTLGQVDLFGRVHEYEHGYRAEKAKIVDLTVGVPLGVDHTEMVAELEARYEVPVRAIPLGDLHEEMKYGYGRVQARDHRGAGAAGGPGTDAARAWAANFTGGAVSSTAGPGTSITYTGPGPRFGAGGGASAGGAGQGAGAGITLLPEAYAKIMADFGAAVTATGTLAGTWKQILDEEEARWRRIRRKVLFSTIGAILSAIAAIVLAVTG